MNMREAVIKTRELHQMVVDGEHENYTVAKYYTDKRCCYLCIIVYSFHNSCCTCPHTNIDRRHCSLSNYDDSPESIIRLNRWLDDPRLEEL